MVFNNQLYLALVEGCRDENGKCAHLPMQCNVYPCAEKKGIKFCYNCSDFPCDHLHPYADQAKFWLEAV